MYGLCFQILLLMPSEVAVEPVFFDKKSKNRTFVELCFFNADLLLKDVVCSPLCIFLR
jgi:hypothetical protein